MCLAFPDVYDIGMSHLGFKILYRILNDHPKTLAERCYAPWVDMQAELRARGLPLVSCETARPLRDFDVVGFSLSADRHVETLGAAIRLSRARSRNPEILILVGGPAFVHDPGLAARLGADATAVDAPSAVHLARTLIRRGVEV